MKLGRISFRRIALIGAIGLSASLLAAAPANAGTSAGTALSPEASLALVERLGYRTAGGYLDATTDRMIVTVTDAGTAREVKAAGAVPRFVARSGAELARATSALNAEARIAGTSWAVDPISNQVVVRVDRTVTGAKLATVRAVAARFGDATRVERDPGELTTLVNGGRPIYTGTGGGGARCSLGFNVTDGSGDRPGGLLFVTAGHCTNLAVTWYNSSSTRLGNRAGSSFPGNDYGIVRYTHAGIPKPGNVYLHNGTDRDISSSGNPVIGQQVLRSGSTTGLHGGSVTALNATVCYAQGCVGGMIQTNVCSEPGDSGGPLFWDKKALGLTSGGSGNCTSGGTTFFQPVQEALSRYGVSVY